MVLNAVLENSETQNYDDEQIKYLAAFLLTSHISPLKEQLLHIYKMNGLLLKNSIIMMKQPLPGLMVQYI